MKVIKTYPKYLTKHVKFFYSVYESGLENIDVIHRRLPDGTLDLIFNLASPVSISRDGKNFAEVPEVVLAGLHPDRSFLQYTGKVNLVGVVFHPGSAHLFVNDTLEHYKSSNVNASMVYGNEVYLLLEQLKDLSCDSTKHNLLEHFMINYLRRKNNKYNSSKISGIIQHIHSMDGNIEMAELYRSHFMSERTFRRQFTEFVGMSPKQYSTIIKVKSFSKRYELARSTYSNIFDRLGYTDQSHFNKDFQKIVGTSPTSYFHQLNKIGEEFIHLI